MIDRIKKTEVVIFSPVVAAYLLLASLYPQVSYDILKFIAFLVLFILLPGYTLSKWLIAEELSPIQRVILGTPASIAVIGILSLIGGYGHVKYLPATICILNIFSIYYLYASYAQRKNAGDSAGFSDDKINYLIILFYLICVSIFFISYTAAYPEPTTDRPGLYFSDALWTLGNTWSYIRFLDSQVLIDARFQGVPFSYHLFQNIYHANIHLFTGIDPFYIQFYISPIFHWFLIISVLLYSGKKIGKISDSRLIIVSILLLFTANFNWPWGRMLNHLYSNPVSFFFGFPAFLLLIVFTYAYLTENNKNIDVAYLTLMFIYAALAKANLMLIFPISFFFIFLVKLIRKEFNIKELNLGLSFLLAIIFLKYTIFSSVRKIGLRKIETVLPKLDNPDNIINSAIDGELLIKVYDILYLIANYLLVFISNSCKFIFQLPFVLILYIYFKNRRDLAFIKDEKLFFWFCLIFGLVSINLILILNIVQVSYFYRYPQIVLLFVCAAFVDYEYRNHRKSKKVLILLLIVGVVSFWNDRIFWMKQGWWHLPNGYYKVWDERVTIDKEEWTALQWLKKNASAKETFFSDREGYIHELDEVKTNRFFGYSSLSGLQAYAEGDGFINRGVKKKIAKRRWKLIKRFLTAKHRNNKIRSLKKIRADYFIQSLRFNKRDYSNIGGLQKIYANPSIIIYRVLDFPNKV